MTKRTSRTKIDDNWLSEQGLVSPGGYKNENSICSGICSVDGCDKQFNGSLKNIRRNKSGLKCMFHNSKAKFKHDFKLFQEFVDTNPHLNELFIFKKEDFDKNFKDHKKKMNKWRQDVFYNTRLLVLKDNKIKGRPSRRVTAYCKKHPDKKIKKNWGTFFRKNKLPPTCKNCCPSGISMEQIYIMNFISIVLGVNVRHAYNHPDGEFCLSTKPLDGFINFNEKEVFDRIRLYNDILNFDVKNRDDGSIFIGFGIEYSPEFWHKERKNCIKRDA